MPNTNIRTREAEAENICDAIEGLAEWITEQYKMCRINLDDAPMWWIMNCDKVKQFIRKTGQENFEEVLNV